MKLRIVLFSLLCSAVALPGARAADDHSHDEHEKHTELEEHMGKMGGAFRRLGRQVTDASRNEDSLKHVATLRTNAEVALQLQPAKLEKVPEADRAKFLSDYQEGIKGLLATLDRLEAALKAGKNEEAAAIVQDIKKLQKQAHDRFMEEKKKKA